MVKWVDREIHPATRAPRNSVEAMIAELSTQPGRWAEIARYSLDRKQSARTRGSMMAKRHPTVEYAVEREADEFVLYLRVKPEGE